MLGTTLPAHGNEYTTGKALNNYQLHPGERAGDFWKMPNVKAGKLRHILFDNDHFKSEERDRLLLPTEATGSVTLFSNL